LTGRGSWKKHRDAREYTAYQLTPIAHGDYLY
jgi:hypothetical protein